MPSSTETALLLEKKHAHGVLQLTLNRPHSLNALNESLYRLLAARLNVHSNRPSTRIIVLTGSGKTFCGGMDIKEATRSEQARSTVSASRLFMDALLGCDKLVFAGVHGNVVGIGVTMLLHCDTVVCTSDTSFQTPFAKVGVVPEFGSSVLFPRLLGKDVADGLLLRGEIADAGKMQRAGLLRIVDGGAREVGERAVEMAVKLSAVAGRDEWGAVLEAKRLLRDPVRRELGAVLKREFAAIERQVGCGATERLMRSRVEEIGRRKARL